MRTFPEVFAELIGGPSPRGWQAELAHDQRCVDRRIRIPTGFGKTLGVLAAWYYHRVQRRDASWPRRLVWVLPMRVLVEQTLHEAQEALRRVGALYPDGDAVSVHALMGGADAGDWHLHPDREAVLVGTQDMLLSRALNRGYGAARGRWPTEFGLLNHDCLWVLDEIQLMDVGLATSVQLQAFRQQDEHKSMRPCRTWWMSATLQPRWLETPDTGELLSRVASVELCESDRAGPIWSVRKPIERHGPLEPEIWAQRAAALHAARPKEPGRFTLLVVNTVDRAVALHGALERLKAPAVRTPSKLGRGGAHPVVHAPSPLAGVDLELVHSRFRPYERRGWREAFLSRAACAGADRIVVATQVVEAGVDISADVLMTEVAPWPSLVQRFGRVARYGGAGVVHVIKVDKPLPYDEQEVDAAWDALGCLDDVGPAALERFETEHPDLLPALYPYEPHHVLLRREVDELFDTTPDLTGADIDVSRFIRTGDERDLQVAWAEIPDKIGRLGPDVPRPEREALCAVPFRRAQAWLCDTGSKLKPGMRAWVWSYLDGAWQRASRADLYPGQIVLVSADSGGYTRKRGFDDKSDDPVEPVAARATPAVVAPYDEADASQDAEDLSAYAWKTIATHGREVGEVAARLAQSLGVPAPLNALIELAGRWHDVGKAHPAFQGSISSQDRPNRPDLAKAPKTAWRRPVDMYRMASDARPRRGFRHELASALALFSVVRLHEPDHEALLGPWREVLDACDLAVEHAAGSAPPGPLEREILRLNAAEFDLLVYLVASHHGKVRARLHAAPVDQDFRSTRDEIERFGNRAMPIRGVLERDRLPALTLVGADGGEHWLPDLVLTLAPASAGLSGVTGASWLDRVQGLLSRFGPFTLAWLEAVLRAADVEASRRLSPDALLATEVTP